MPEPSETELYDADFVALFPGRYPQPETPADFDHALIVLDTNVLLDLYKYSADVTATWFDILMRLKGRVFIPHQVMEEFWRNRGTIALTPDSTIAARADVAKSLRAARSRYEGWLKSRGLQADAQETALLEQIETAQTRLDEMFQDAISKHNDRFDALPHKDEIVQRIVELTSGSDGATLGRPYSASELKNLYADGDKRFKEKIPPGYMDDGNNPEAKAGKDTDKKYGDFVLWRQALDFARDFTADEAITTLILVTGDLKQDWWQTVTLSKDESGEKATTRMPRYELLDEVRTELGMTYAQLEPRAFLSDAAAALGISLSEDAKRATEAIASAWLPETFYIKSRYGELASARISPDRKTCLVLKGSTARKIDEYTLTTPTHIAPRAQELLDEGLLRDIGSDRYTFTANVEFSSTSMAAAVVVGRPASGNVTWMTSNDISLGQYMSNLSMDSEDD